MCKHCKTMTALENSDWCRGCWAGWWLCVQITAVVKHDVRSTAGADPRKAGS